MICLYMIIIFHFNFGAYHFFRFSLPTVFCLSKCLRKKTLSRMPYISHLIKHFIYRQYFLATNGAFKPANAQTSLRIAYAQAGLSIHWWACSSAVAFFPQLHLVVLKKQTPTNAPLKQNDINFYTVQPLARLLVTQLFLVQSPVETLSMRHCHAQSRPPLSLQPPTPAIQYCRSDPTG